MPDNSTYEGYLKNNEFDGYGELRTKNYNYFGEFSLGKKHGEGRLEDLVKNVEYKGTFVNNMKEGYGEERYKDGSIYKGQFKENMKHGKGIILLQGDGNYGYEGDFKEDKISGKGKFKWNSKKEYIGEWENNEISGYGILLEDKIRHIGFFSHDVKQGYGATFSIEKSFVLLGKWENDLIEGPSILLNLPDINEDNISFDNEIIVGMFKGEIINMSLDEEDLLLIYSNLKIVKIIKILINYIKKNFSLIIASTSKKIRYFNFFFPIPYNIINSSYSCYLIFLPDSKLEILFSNRIPKFTDKFKFEFL